MNLAPIVSVTGTPCTIAGGVRGVFQTMRVMREIIRAYKVNPEIRQAAISCIYLTPEKIELGEVNAIFEFVRDTIRYVRDIYAVETIATPDKTLQLKIGDCDDQTTLLGSMLEAVGYPVRLVVAGYYRADTLEHVYLQVCVNGYWVNCDPTEHEPIGYAPPDPLLMYIENL